MIYNALCLLSCQFPFRISETRGAWNEQASRQSGPRRRARRRQDYRRGRSSRPENDRDAIAPRRSLPAGRDIRHDPQFLQRYRRSESALPRRRIRTYQPLRRKSRAPDVSDGVWLAGPHSLGIARRARLLCRKRLGIVSPYPARRPDYRDRARGGGRGKCQRSYADRCR